VVRSYWKLLWPFSSKSFLVHRLRSFLPVCTTDASLQNKAINTTVSPNLVSKTWRLSTAKMRTRRHQNLCLRYAHVTEVRCGNFMSRVRTCWYVVVGWIMTRNWDRYMTAVWSRVTLPFGIWDADFEIEICNKKFW